MFKKYRFGFDVFGLILFLLVMIPNFIWFALPAPNDVLRAESITPIIDGIGSVAQVVFIAAICMLIRRDVGKVRLSKSVVLSLIMLFTYYVGWILYYNGVVNPGIIGLLTIPPCMAFILYALGRKNAIAIIPAGLFTICHVIYAIVNYII